MWAAVRSLAESPSFNLVLTITMLVLTAMLASFLLLCIVAMRRRMRHADADGSGNAHHSKRARRKCALLICMELYICTVDVNGVAFRAYS